jgi:hydrogenase nickel incorporation protein HypB
MTNYAGLGAAHGIQNVKVVKSLLANNDLVAAENRARLDAAGVLAINLMASPGAGKTSLISRLVGAVGTARLGVIEGDLAGSIDTEKVLAAGAADAVQINTGGTCHLEASMIRQALDSLDLAALDLLVIENVGNLICPTHWALGEHLKLCVLSTAEGHDKPLKYPEIFAVSDVIVVNKIDLIELVDFERPRFYELVRALNPQAPIFELSCRTGEGIADFGFWILGQWKNVL